MTEANGNQTVGNVSRSTFDTICPGYHAETTLSLAFSIDSLDSEKLTSDKILVANHLKWFMYIEVQEIEGIMFILPYVDAEGMFKHPMTFDLEYTLEAKNTSDRITSPTERFEYDDPTYNHVGYNLIPFNTLLNDREKFEVDGIVTVTAKLKISMPMCCNFNVANSFCDVTINIGIGENTFPFPFNKATLAAHSSVFENSFGELQKREQDTLTFDYIKPSAFVNLINVLFVRSFELKTNSVAAVLELADSFNIISIVDHCEKLLVKCGLDSEPCLTERLVLATDYSLKNLQKRCLELCNSPNIIKYVMGSPFYKDLSSDGRALLLHRVFEVLPTYDRYIPISGRSSKPIRNKGALPPSRQHWQSGNKTARSKEVVEVNEGEDINNLSGSVNNTICPGYNVETTISLAFSIDSVNHMQTSEPVLVASHLKWYIYVKPRMNGDENCLEAFVVSDDMKKYPLTYEAEFALEAKGAFRRIKAMRTTNSYDGPTYTNGHWMISCEKLLKNRKKFETNGKVTFTVKLKVSMPMCYNFNAMNSFSDVTIKIGQFSFPFSKAALAMHSSFFHAMFFGSFKESGEDVVTLEDVNLVAFVKLINVLFVRSLSLKMSSVAAVLELADRFDMITIVDHCEQLLMKCVLDCKPCLAERLVIATKYSLNNLQKRCLELCKSIEAIKKVMESPFYKDLSSDAKAMLLDRVKEQNNKNVLRISQQKEPQKPIVDKCVLS